jgi:hypothetical protein
MKIVYTARNVFGPGSMPDNELVQQAFGFVPEKSWENFIGCSGNEEKWETVTLDVFLNEPLAEVDDPDRERYWDNICQIGIFHTDFFYSLDFVTAGTKKLKYYNLMALAIEPEEDCRNIVLDGFEFLGYELLDDHLSHSTLSNCGGFDKSFLPSELNRYSLLDDFERAYEIKWSLRENYPDHGHSVATVIGIWRHEHLGRIGVAHKV